MHQKETTNRLSCERARAFPIERALAKLGHFPTRTNDKEAWFLSPLRLEIQASFKVSKKLNKWYDHGEGTGGNVIDLICRIEHCTVREALRIIGDDQTSFSFQQRSLSGIQKDRGLKVLHARPIRHCALIKYLSERRISIATASSICKEVHYLLKGRRYFAIGLENDSGGWELRNRYYKNCSSPKDSTHIKKGNLRLIVTEGMFDLLSLLEQHPKLASESDFLVLNSAAFFKKVPARLKEYDSIELYLDNDMTGRKLTEKLMAASEKCIDRSRLYEGFKDMNEWIVKSAKE